MTEHGTSEPIAEEVVPAGTGPEAIVLTRIPTSEVNRLVEDGQAKRWTEPAGGLVAMAVEIDGQWWGMREGSDGYERMGEHESHRLTHYRTAFELRDRARAEVAALAATSLGTHPTLPR